MGKKKPALNRQRNILHDHPMMKKGGVHQKTKKAKRMLDKIALKRGLFSPSAFIEVCFEKKGFAVMGLVSG